jgi:hypothetical protein
MRSYTERDVELAWVGGFISGDGTITTNNLHGKRYVRLKAAQSNGTDELERVQSVIGGTITGPYMSPAKRRNVYQLQLAGREKVEAALNELWPYLSHKKREQANRALAVSA